MLARNVLIFQSGALGDFVLTWPLAMALARLFPQSRIYYVTAAQKGALAERVLRVEYADAEAGWHALFAEMLALPPAAERLLQGAHTIVNLATTAGSTWAKNVQSIAPAAKLSNLNTRPSAEFTGHIVDFLIEQWRDWPAAHATASQILRGIQDRGIAGVNLQPRATLIHPGSGSPQKNWPAQRFLDLAKALKGSGRAVRFLLGEVEIERWPAALIDEFAGVAEVRRPATYVDLLNEISAAVHFVGNDSGPGHLAGIVGVKTVTLFGTLSPKQWKPLGPHVQPIEGPLEKISVEDVLRIIDQG